MPRPSRNLDRALIAAGRELFPARGCAGLSVREVADAAGVNLGMFHYHFKSREAFLRAMMQASYEEMFHILTLEMGRPGETAEHLEHALRAIARFVRDNRRFLARLLSDALTGEPCAREFMRDNLPRHLNVLRGLIAKGQQEGIFVAVPLTQAMGLCAGSLAMPILAGGALVDSGELEPATARMIETTLLTDAALDQRIGLALRALLQQQPKAPAATRAKPTNRKRKAR